MMKAWQINEDEIYSGETMEDAIHAAMKLRGESRDEVLGGYDPHEVDSSCTVGDPDQPDIENTTIGAMLVGLTASTLLCEVNH